MKPTTKSDWLLFGISMLIIALMNWLFYSMGEPRTVWIINMLSEWFNL